ncbi:MAG: hypothetical protein JSV42_18285 [Chloroflexota bacterium]|nr:MAG: hypothetical protein JSV42_18285 [Chloroflexota bacterium]
MIAELNSLGWFLIGVIALAFLQRRLHFEIQSVLFLLTRRIDLAIAIFSILFLPGVFLHELSHYFMARLLRVPVGKFSIIPQSLPDGRLRLGYVETASTDFLRDAFIGTAPLIAGSLFVAYAGFLQLNFDLFWGQLSSNQLSAVVMGISQMADQPDFWIWFYLVFVVSSTMFPSATDRRAWNMLLVFLGVFVALLLIFGAGPWLWETLGTRFMGVVEVFSIIFMLSVLVHLIFLPPLWISRVFLEKIFNLKVVR